MSELPIDPSGICVHDGQLLVVGNRSNRRYFRFEMASLPEAAGVISLQQLPDPDVIAMDHSKASDLESIDVLQKQIVVLSEHSRRLFCHGRTIVDYSDLPSLKERRGRGLEGLAIRNDDDGSAWIAIVHEGRERKQNHPGHPPLLLIHQVAAGAPECRLKLRQTWWEKQLLPAAIAPCLDDDQLRCPDLVWSWSSSLKQWGLLLLLTHHDKSPAKRHLKYVQWYNQLGEPAGEPHFLNDLGMPAEFLDRNWEGLCWHTDADGQNCLLLVNDTRNPEEMALARLYAPENCLRGPDQ